MLDSGLGGWALEVPSTGRWQLADDGISKGGGRASGVDLGI